MTPRPWRLPTFKPGNLFLISHTAYSIHGICPGDIHVENHDRIKSSPSVSRESGMHSKLSLEQQNLRCCWCAHPKSEDQSREQYSVLHMALDSPIGDFRGLLRGVPTVKIFFNLGSPMSDRDSICLGTYTPSATQNGEMPKSSAPRLFLNHPGALVSHSSSF